MSMREGEGRARCGGDGAGGVRRVGVVDGEGGYAAAQDARLGRQKSSLFGQARIVRRTFAR